MTPDDLRRRNFITVQELATEVLGVDERTARRAIEQGQIPAVKVGTKTLIPAPRLAALIDPPDTTPAGPLAAVEAAGPDAITAAAEILRGALRALEALAGPGHANGPVPPDQAAADKPAHHQHAENG